MLGKSHDVGEVHGPPAWTKWVRDARLQGPDSAGDDRSTDRNDRETGAVRTLGDVLEPPSSMTSPGCLHVGCLAEEEPPQEKQLIDVGGSCVA